MLARAVGANMEVAIRPILEQMFSVGLSLELTSALKVLAQEIPALQKEIQGERTRTAYNSIVSTVHSLIRWAS